jgi:hypothetical protein
MKAVRHRASGREATTVVEDASSKELKVRLRSLNDNSLTDLADALEAMRTGTAPTVRARTA